MEKGRKMQLLINKNNLCILDDLIKIIEEKEISIKGYNAIILKINEILIKILFNKIINFLNFKD